MSLDVWLYYEIDGNKIEVFDANITHNLNKMASAARIYEEVWRPEVIGVKTASELVYPIKQALRDMKDREEYYKRYDSPNGWGLYKHFYPWLVEYWKACVRHPSARIGVSR